MSAHAGGCRPRRRKYIDEKRLWRVRNQGVTQESVALGVAEETQIERRGRKLARTRERRDGFRLEASRTLRRRTRTRRLSL